MSELPKGWAEVPLGDFAARTKNIDPTAHAAVEFDLYSVPSYANGLPEIVTGAEIGSTKQVVRQDDVLLCKIIPHLNRVWTIPEPFSREQIASPEWLVYRDHGCVPDYLRAALSEQSFREKFLQTKSGVGGSLTRARAALVNQILIPIAPLPEQRRIVKKVDGLTVRTARARKELDRIPTLIARYKQRLLALAFSGELTGGTGGWRTATIGDLADTQLGKMLDKAKNKGEPTKYLRNINVRWYDFELDDVLEMPMSDEERRKFAIKDGDILTCEGGEPGRSAIWNKGPTDLAFQKALIRIRPDLEQLNPSYLVHHLKFLADAQELERHFTGSTIKHLPQRALQCVELPVPPVEEQAEIVRRIEFAFGWLDRMAADHAAAARLLPKLDAAILSKAFQGRLVPQDPKDEPASALLQTLKAEGFIPQFLHKSAGNRSKVDNRPPDLERPIVEEVDSPGILKPDKYYINREFLTSHEISRIERSPRFRRSAHMTALEKRQKSRQDFDVWQQPYLADLLQDLQIVDVNVLFPVTGLSVSDFYKQLVWEIDAGLIIEDANLLRVA